MHQGLRRAAFHLVWLLLAGLACALPGGGDAGETSLTVTPAGPATPTLAARLSPTPGNGDAATTGTVASDEAPAATVDPLATPTLATPGDAGEGENGTAADGSGDDTDGGDGSGDDDDDGDGGDGDDSTTDGGGTVAASCPASGDNVLLANGAFEGAFEEFGGIDELKTPRPWKPWFLSGEGIFPPEYKPGDFPGRFLSGSTSQQYFKSFGQFIAGVYQQVVGATPGATYQFSAYGQGWSCEDFSQCGGGVSYNPANMFMRVGIDPYGGTDATSPDVVWSPYFNPIDRWEVACVSTAAIFDTITVFTYASPDGPRQNQDVYWDDAKLVQLP